VCNKPIAKHLQAHHLTYAYSSNEVKNNPELAKENVIWVCYHCHKVSNAIRIMIENPAKSAKILNLIKGIIHGKV
jgi:hypothetical protein